MDPGDWAHTNRRQKPYIGDKMPRTKSIQDRPHDLDWRDALTGAGPRYVQVLRFLEKAIAANLLRPGDRLPPQRRLAKQLGLDLTTVTRVYAEASARHLVHARGALGTFVSAPAVELAPVLDLSMNIPPSPPDTDITELLKAGLARLLAHTNADRLMSYQVAGGGRAERSAGARWLSPMFGAVNPARISVAPGAQAALAGLVLALTRTGEGILTTAMTYPGLLHVSRELARPLVVVDSDEFGMRPDALSRASKEGYGRVVYVNPTLQNPTMATMPEQRRRDIAKVALQYDLQIIEDDPYWLLADAPPPPIAELAPERTHYISTLSKCLAPGLRTAYVVSPDDDAQQRYLSALTAITLVPAPLAIAIATQWIYDGTAKHLCDGVNIETRARQELAEQILAGEDLSWPKGAMHIWYALPEAWTPTELARAARMEGLAVTPSVAFSVGEKEVQAIRISLGGVRDRLGLGDALQRLVGLIQSK